MMAVMSRLEPGQGRSRAIEKFLTMTDADRIKLAGELTAKRTAKNPRVKPLYDKMTVRERCLIALENIERHGAIPTA